MSTLLEQASLVMIPSGYKEDVVYSQIPTDGSGDLSFTRASNGTRINSAGLVEVVAWNLAQYSEDFSNVIWESVAVSVSANTTTAPNGTNTADTATIATAGGHNLRQNISVSPNTVYTFSFYVKRGTATGLSYSVYNNTGLQDIVPATSYYSQTSSSQWTRISVTFTTPSNCTQIYIYPLRDGSSTGTVFLWGAQLNIGSTAKPYFPTTDRLNVPRLTYQNGGGGCPSLLLEKQSTNLLTYSEQFDNAAWTKDGVTISANATTSPDGTQNADKIIGAASSGNKIIFQVNSITLGQPFTASAFFKKGEYKNAFLRVGGQTANPYVIYDLDTQSVVSTSGASSTQIESMGNSWYRISLTSLSATTTVIAPNVAFAPNSGYTISATNVLQYTGDGTSGGFAWGAQIEISSYKTSYIPTTSSSATRVADACYKTGISSLIGQTEGTLFLDFDNGANDGVDYVFGLNDGTADNRIIIYRSSGARVVTEVRTSGTPQATIQTSPVSANSRNKCAVAYKANDIVLYVNGTQVGVDTSATIPTCSGLYSNGGGGSSPFLRPINEIIVFKTRLTNDELASLTTI
jgi:hypothetical protein